MSEVIKVVTLPKVELVEQSSEQLPSKWHGNGAIDDLPIRLFDEPKPPTQIELLRQAMDTDRILGKSWATNPV